MWHVLLVLILGFNMTPGVMAKKALFADKGPCSSKLLPDMSLQDVGDCLMTRDKKEWNARFFRAVKADVVHAKKNRRGHEIAWVKEAEEVGDYLQELEKLSDLQLRARPGHASAAVQKDLEAAIKALLVDEEKEDEQEEAWEEEHDIDLWNEEEEELGLVSLDPEEFKLVEEEGIDSIEELYREEEAEEHHEEPENVHIKKLAHDLREAEHNTEERDKHISKWDEYLGTHYRLKKNNKKHTIKVKYLGVVIHVSREEGYAIIHIFGAQDKKMNGTLAKLHIGHDTKPLERGVSVVMFQKLEPSSHPVKEHGHKITHLVGADSWFLFDNKEAYKMLHPQVMHRRAQHKRHH